MRINKNIKKKDYLGGLLMYVLYFCLNSLTLKITFLGTGTSQGVPIIACSCDVCSSKNAKDKRLRTSALVEIDGMTIVIDAGPDFRSQMLREQVKSLDAILITHHHKDHTGGIDDVRAFNYVLQRPMDIYARQDVIEGIKRELFYAFEAEKYPGVPELTMHSIANEPFSVGSVIVLPVEVLHYKTLINGYRIRDFVYITDAKSITETEKNKLLGAKLIVVNALRKQPHITHFSLEEAIALIQELKPERAYLTHISHQMGLHDIVEKELPDNIHLAYDGLKINL